MEIIKLLLDKGAEGIDRVLMAGVNSGNAVLVQAALDKGGLEPETLTRALGAARSQNKTEISAMLEKVGAVPPPPPAKVDAATLSRYAGVIPRIRAGADFFRKRAKTLRRSPRALLYLTSLAIITSPRRENSGCITPGISRGGRRSANAIPTTVVDGARRRLHAVVGQSRQIKLRLCGLNKGLLADRSSVVPP